MSKHIFVLYTGGTIGMRQSKQGLTPDTELVNKALAPFSDGLTFDWHVCEPLIDSSAVTLQNWQDWLVILTKALPQYDGVLVLHGTDTLAYTANIFALALQNLNKPIVLTGSQWPFSQVGSDAPLNLATAVAAFNLPDFAEVAIAFNGALLPAIGSSKISTEDAAGFANPHFGVLAQWSLAQGWQQSRVQKPESDGALACLPLDPKIKVHCYTLIPGVSVHSVSEQLRASFAEGVVLQSYGHGNAPNDKAFIDAVKSFSQKGGVVLNISQVPKGCAAAVYAQGNALRQAGVINGGKANLETATALLTLFAHHGANSVEAQLQRLKLI